MRSFAPPLLGATTPRIFTRPLVTGRAGSCGCGCALSAATSLGFSAVEFAADVLGIRLFPWQRWLLIHALELRPDGRFRFRTVLVLVARQNGKTTLVEVKNLWKMFVLQVPLVIGTAQNLDVSEESWDKAVEIVEGTPELYADVAVPKDGRGIVRVNGKKTLRLRSGSRWKVAAVSRRGGRGLSGDDVNLDELREHQTWEAWGAVTKTTMARRKAQVWGFSNAGDDKSVVLNDLQAKGRLAAEHPESDSSLGHFEWSAPLDCRIDDETMWPLPNPSLGYEDGVSVEALRSALETDPEPLFRTECLCQRVPDMRPQWSVVPKAAWVARLVPPVRAEPPVAFGVAASWPDAESTSIGLVGRSGGRLVGQVVERRPGTSWVLDRLVELDRHQHCGFVIDPAGPAGRLVPEVEAKGLNLVKATAREVAQACGQFYGQVCGDAPNFAHFGQDELDQAVAGAGKHPVGDAWRWDRQPQGDPLEAITLAAWGHATRAQSGQFFAAYR